MKVYLDNSATTKPREEVVKDMIEILSSDYGNPSSLHRMGLEAEKRVEGARNSLANFLGVRKEEVFFTSGGTESNNIAIQGLVNKFRRRGNHIITTCVEHSSVFNIFKKYEEKGFRVTYLKVDRYGRIDLKELKDCIDGETILISIMMVNNEIGSIQPIKEIKEMINSTNKDIKLHVDGIQAFGKIPVNVKALGVDTFSFSGHKFHGPKGIGGLYVRKDLHIEPLVLGGNQERGLRSGTENVPGIVGIGKATKLLEENFEEERERLKELKGYFSDGIKATIKDIKINSLLDDGGAPHILNVSFMGVRGEVLLHYLEEAGIYVSTGSACSSHKKGKSKVLHAIGLSDKEIDGTVRFSFAYSNTKEELDYALDKLKYAVEEIRKITMR